MEVKARLAIEKTNHDAGATAAAGEPSAEAETPGAGDTATWRAEQEKAVGGDIRVGPKAVETRTVRNSARSPKTVLGGLYKRKLLGRILELGPKQSKRGW